MKKHTKKIIIFTLLAALVGVLIAFYCLTQAAPADKVIVPEGQTQISVEEKTDVKNEEAGASNEQELKQAETSQVTPAPTEDKSEQKQEENLQKESASAQPPAQEPSEEKMQEQEKRAKEPSQSPRPEEPQESALKGDEPKEKVTAPLNETVCTLSVRCDDVLKHMDKLPKEKRGIIPQNGVIFMEQTVAFSEGDSVFDVLLRKMTEKGIHLEYVNNPMYNSAYIEGIGNLYEFDCGDTAGWMYKVNGVKPTFGCSQYILKPGDRIEFFYQCSMFE